MSIGQFRELHASHFGTEYVVTTYSRTRVRAISACLDVAGNSETYPEGEFSTYSPVRSPAIYSLTLQFLSTEHPNSNTHSIYRGLLRRTSWEMYA